MTDKGPPRGVKSRLLGVSLIILASLNMMVSWRGAMEVSLWQVLILGVGVAFFGYGAAKGASHT